MAYTVVENWYDREILHKYSISEKIDLLQESIEMDMMLYDNDIITEGVLDTIKEKVLEMIAKIIEWFTTLKSKIKDMLAAKTSPATVEANFKAAKQRASSKTESYIVESLDDEIAKANERIHQIVEDNSPIYNFRNHSANIFLDDVEEIIEEIRDNIKNKREIKTRTASRLEKYGSPDEFFKDKCDYYTGNIVSANADYVNNGLNYFMNDFKRIHNHISGYEKDIDKITNELKAISNQMKASTDQEEIKACMAGLAELNAGKTLLVAWVRELNKTLKIITRISEIAAGPHMSKAEKIAGTTRPFKTREEVKTFMKDKDSFLSI